MSLLYVYLYARETAALGGVSLALRGSAAFGATFGEPSAPIWKTPPSAAFLPKKKFGAPTPNLGRLRRPIWNGFGGGKKIKKIGAP